MEPVAATAAAAAPSNFMTCRDIRHTNCYHLYVPGFAVVWIHVDKEKSEQNECQ